jgi:hypothetical protein
MKLKRNLAAKITAVVASLLGLGAVLGLVHQNPPPAAANAVSTTSDAAPAVAPTGARQPSAPMSTPAAAPTSARQRSAPTPIPVTKRQTRTRVS